MGAVAPLLLLFSLAGGYAFLQLCHFSKHRWDALEWERNFFEAALVGAALFLVARLTILLLGGMPAAVVVRDVIRAAMPFPLAASFTATLVLAFSLAWLVNLRVPRERAIHRAVMRHGGELLILLQHAARHSLPVSLTMTHRKVYVGFILAPPSAKYPYTKLIPTVSGHRDEATLNVVFDTPYWPVYEDLERRRRAGEQAGVDVDSFGIVLPLAEVCSANLFDEDTYVRYFNAAAPDATGAETEAAPSVRAGEEGSTPPSATPR